MDPAGVSTIGRNVRLTRRQMASIAIAAGLSGNAMMQTVPPTTLAQTKGSIVASYRGNAARTAEMPGPAPDYTYGIEERWQFKRGNWTSACMAANGTAYIGNDDGNLYALDLQTGSELWHVSTGGSLSGPTIGDDAMCVCSGDGNLYALALSDGTERWRFPSSISFGEPLVHENTIVVGLIGGVALLDAQTGAERWRYSNDEESTLTPATNGRMVITSSSSGTIYALDANDGSERWRFSSGEWASAPVIVDDLAYVATDDGHFYALDTENGMERWRFYTDSSGSSPAVSNGVAYTCTTDGTIYALDTQDGTELWRNHFGTFLRAPVVENDTLFTTNDSGAIFAVNTLNGSINWQTEIPAEYGVSWPVVIDELVIVNDLQGTLYALGASPARLASGGNARISTTTMLRGAPNATAVERGELEPGTSVTLTGESVTTDNTVWWPVDVNGTNLNGWVEESVLEPV